MRLDADARSEDAIDAQTRARRVKQMLVVGLLAIAMSTAASVARSQWLDAVTLAFAAVALLGAWLYAHAGRPDQATTVLLGTLTATVTVFVWRHAGVHDTAMLAYPGILVFASMGGRRRLLLRLFGFIALVIVAVVLGNVQGWRVDFVQAPRLSDMVHPLGILAATGASVWLMATDLRQALRRLKAENARVLDAQQRIEFIATHDTVTGLPNRILARDRFEHAKANAQRHQSKAALLYLDLDDFKSINDWLGYHAGDALLQQVGTRLRSVLRATDTVCRVGGDEFLVLVGELAGGDDAAKVAQKVLQQLTAPFQVNDLDVSSACSIGVTVYPDDGGDFDSLLKRADTAMNRAKEAGRNTYRFFDAEMNASVVEHVHLASAMRLALARGEFALHYQPQIDLATGRIVGAEALVRWRHPELGLVPPARFIPVAEKSGLIVPIGAWVLQEACRQAVRWHAAGLDDLVMAVNVSPVQILRGDIDSLVLNTLSETGLRPDKLELELTESILLQDSTTLSDALGRLRRLGVTFAIDDFGTGYSNLGYLKRFEVERLKIDQSFVRRMLDDSHDDAIVRAIVQMSQSLNLTTIAEGVEDRATLDRLTSLGCSQAQGYLWSRPLPAQEFLAFALAHSATHAPAVERVSAGAT